MSKEIMHSSLFQLLLKNEKEAADRVYLRQPRKGIWHEFTWAEVMSQARKVANFLQKTGIKKGAHVAIISKNCAEWFITDFGIHLAGMVTIPLFYNQNEENTHYVLAHAEVELVFIGKLDDHRRVRNFIPEKYVAVSFDYHDDIKVNYKWSEIMAYEPLLELTAPAADELYTIIYSSGTSGTPKGAMYTNRSIANYLSLFPMDIARIRYLKHYHLVSYLPLAHVYERSAIELASICISSDVSFIESLEKFADNLCEIQPAFFTAVPRIWGVFQHRIEQKIAAKKLNLLLKIPFVSSLIKKKIHTSLGLNACFNYFSGASHLPESILRFFDKLDIQILEGYGQTENLAYATVSLIDERREGYVGTPRLEVKIKLAADSELLMDSPCIMSGYFKEEEATKNTFTEDGWLRTGDVGEIDAEGRVKILGRLSENFKNQTGEFVSPFPIEKQFASNPVIEQLCLVGKCLPGNVLLVTLNEAADGSDRKKISSSLQEMLSKINSKLVKHERVNHVIVVKDVWSTDNNMLTPTLKVKRKAVEKHYEDFVQSVFAQRNAIIWQ